MLRILVVEDHTDTRRMLELFLKTLGHQVELAKNIEEAFSLFVAGGKRFDFLLSDLKLPDGTGWDLMQRLTEAGCAPPKAIAISGWGSPDDLLRSRKAGFRAHLVKPVASEVLKATLASAGDPEKGFAQSS